MVVLCKLLLGGGCWPILLNFTLHASCIKWIPSELPQCCCYKSKSRLSFLLRLAGVMFQYLSICPELSVRQVMTQNNRNVFSPRALKMGNMGSQAAWAGFLWEPSGRICSMPLLGSWVCAGHPQCLMLGDVSPWSSGCHMISPVRLLRCLSLLSRVATVALCGLGLP